MNDAVAVAKAKSLRISSMKLRRIARLIKDMKVENALAMLNHMPQKGAKMVYKVLFAAKANFLHKNPNGDTTPLSVSTIFVNEGTAFARFKPRARGRADRMYRGTAHLTLYLGNKE
ncbi:MAG: 50S ribosomal protein L22 [Spirochaetota bacterium]|nr:50S ribosomal protein L22 [Spirochaetota bacterium]